MKNPSRVLRPFSHQFCRRAKIRVTAHPHFRAARCPSFFPAGFDFNKGQEMLRSAEQPHPHGTGKPHESMDWRICGEQDARPEGCR